MYFAFDFFSPMFSDISKKEFKILGLTAVFLVLAAMSPYLYGYFKTPEDHVFLGNGMLNIADQPVYYTYIEQIKNGSFLNFDFYSPETQERGIFQISWFVPGFFARILAPLENCHFLTGLNFSAIFAFHFWRIFLIPILVFVLYLFISLFFRKVVPRFVAFFLALFGSGWGAYALCFLPPALADSPKFLPLDLWVPESNTFLSLLVTSHFILSLIFILLVFYFWIFYLKTGRLFFSVFSGLCGLVLFGFHPYFVSIIYAVIFLSTSVIALKEKSYKNLIGLFIFALLSLPAVCYHLYLTNADFLLRMRSVEIQGSAFMPNIFAALVGYGFFGLLGLGGALGNFFKIKNREWLVIYIWFFVNILFFFIPFIFPRRLTEGFQIPLALFAALALARLPEEAFFSRTKIVICLASFFLILTPTAWFNFFHFHTIYASAVSSEEIRHFFYRDKNSVEAMRWIRQETPADSIIIAEPWNGNILPYFAFRRVFFGHSDETIFSQSRRQELEWFFGNNAQDGLKKEFLKTNGIDCVFWSRREDELGDYKPDEKDYLKKAYESGPVKIYQVLF